MGKKFVFKYSTVDEYFAAVFKRQREANFTWPVYTSDFFPYNGYHMAHFWTGYFTSRPHFKKMVRDFTAQTHASDTYYSLQLIQKMNSGSKDEIDSFKQSHAQVVKVINELVGTNIHHDTITGTSPNVVIQNETSTILDKAYMNSRVFSASFHQRTELEEGILIEGLEACIRKAHSRDVCP
jgi:hypothetical protein